MVMNEQLLRAFFEDLAVAMDGWVDDVAKSVEAPDVNSEWMEDPEPVRRLSTALAAQTDDLRPVLTEAMRGLVHSFLVILDGGTASAEVGRVHLTDAQGQVLAEGMHELFFDHLYESGRM